MHNVLFFYCEQGSPNQWLPNSFIEKFPFKFLVSNGLPLKILRLRKPRKGMTRGKGWKLLFLQAIKGFTRSSLLIVTMGKYIL